ncbi:MAG: DUF5615 family PIN-like protein [Deltaproteobacteria bacterium]|nr:DUF5615 family PIN-like protein [Deltaproteobacteria bacterium]
MKLLLDECLPRKLKSYFKSHEVKTAPEMGWAGKTNGELLELASSQFDVFITADQNLTFQQNLEKAKLGVLVFVASDNKLETLIPLIPEALSKLKEIKERDIVKVGINIVFPDRSLYK